MNTNNQSILITGCSSGIGLSTAIDLAKLGYRVFATCRSQTDVERLHNQYKSEHYNLKNNLTFLQLDVTDSSSIQRALDEILLETNGRLDALFNNAGIAVPGAVEDLTKEAMEQQFATNVFGLLELTNKVIPIMREQGNGKIIVVSSILGFISMRYRGAYISSKFALEGLFNTLRLELRDSPIKVSIIQPGPITSNFRTNAYNNYIKDKTDKEVETSVHFEEYKHLQKKFAASIENKKSKPDLFELPPEAVSKKVLKILQSRNPRARYSVTVPTYLFRFLVRILPTSILDKLLYKISQVETSK